MFFYSRFVKLFSLSFLNDERALRAFSQAGAETVAVFFRNNPRLSVHKLDRSFRAGGHAGPASVAQLIVDSYDLSFNFHSFLPLLNSSGFLI
jgi:hypothetical protein